MNATADDWPLTGDGDRAAISTPGETISHSELGSRVGALAADLNRAGVRRMALYADNGIDWIVADLACSQTGTVLTPLPLFFSGRQLAHAVRCSGSDSILSDRPEAVLRSAFGVIVATDRPSSEGLRLYRVESPARAELPANTAKITFTSGTTGEPKGVCLSLEHQRQVAAALVTAVGAGVRRHLCVLPMSTLLENIAGVYAPLLAGGCVVAPPLADVGLSGSSGLDVAALTTAITHYEPHSLILVPELLTALCAAAEFGWQPPESLSFVAVGGARVSPTLLERARRNGLPVFEGYGLSECASVVCLNTQRSDRVGSVGRPLPHVRLRLDGREIVVAGSTFLGYAGQPESWLNTEVRSGDLGRIDTDGFVFVDGRRKHVLITSYGRNVSPEWIESELLNGTVLRQAVVFGDARPFCVALVYPNDPSASDDDIESWIRTANRRLPDYAHVDGWRRLPRALSPAEGTATDNGRPRRRRIEQIYGTDIDAIYSAAMENCRI